MFSLVVDDCIARKILDFRQKIFTDLTDLDEIQKILQYYKSNPLFSNIDDLKRYYGEDLITSILSQNSRLYADNPSIEELAKKTIYKIILTLDQDNFPYVNVNQSKIKNSFCSTFRKTESRNNAISHFKALLENANFVIFYDRFLYQENIQEAFEAFAKECFPQQSLNIHIHDFSNWKDFGSRIKRLCRNWSVSLLNTQNESRYSNLHDRYIIIDDKLEIILTSGIEHLMHENKDFTYVLNLL